MNIFSCIFVIIGSIIGAGFASGKEIYTFFYVYGERGLIGIMISFLLIGCIIYKSLKIIKKYNVNNYNDFLKIIIPKKNINLETIINFIINTFLIITFFIMCAGFSAYFNQEFGINKIYSGIFISIISYLILNKNAKGIFFINSILIPLIIIILIILGFKSFGTVGDFLIITNTWKWLPKALLYASYNSVTLISILIPMKKYIKNKKDILKVTMLSAIFTIIMALIIICLLLNIKTDINKIELPAVYASGLFGNTYKILYGVIILGAIITTEISDGFGFLNNISKTKEKYNLYNKIICIASIPVSLFGFSNLVNNFYPIFGVLGLIQIFLILKCK